MSTLRRTTSFITFTLIEYVRSGRALLEMLATPVFFYLFLWRGVAQLDYFFTTVGLFTLALTFSVTSALFRLGDRPQSYLVLVRRISRSSYLLGLYLASLFVVLVYYVLVCMAALLLQRVAGLDLRNWLLGSAPLLLNAALLGALLTLLSPIVLPSGWRLTILALGAIALSGNLISGPMVEQLGSFNMVLDVLRTIFSTPLVPAFTGFAMAISRDYGQFGYLILIAQAALTIVLLALAVYAFSRNDLIFNPN
jgi:hypothetical protein